MTCQRMRSWPVFLAVLVAAVTPVVAACGGSGGAGASQPAAEASRVPGESSSPGSSALPLAAADAQAVRDLMKAYWAAYNAYDADKALSCLEESYRAAEDDAVRGEIRQIKTFGVKLGVTERSAPVTTGDDRAEMYVDMKEPTGERVLVMRFARAAGVWRITLVEEVE